VTQPRARKRCLVAYALRERQYLWSVELEPSALIEDALAAARTQHEELGGSDPIPWDKARVGIYGEARRRTDPCAEGDRIELYRPLAVDPRLRRRERVARERRAGTKSGKR